MHPFPSYDELIAGVERDINTRTVFPKVDVVINVYGKPFNTAVTLYTLLKQSGQWIDKIYFIQERKQPHNANFGFIKAAFGNRIISYTPRMWLWVRPLRTKFFFKFPTFRKAVRYQYGWEQTDKDFLFITHNDVLYTNDVIGAMLQRIGYNIGIGPVGQCWNCPAHFAGVCTPETYTEYRPSYSELVSIMKQHPGKREKNYSSLPHNPHPWPLPECRLNEWTAMINMKLARGATMPIGKAVPFGAFYGLDIGTRWFSDVLNMGYTVANFNIDDYARHAWAGKERSGHAALFDVDEYVRCEIDAEDFLIAEQTNT